MFERYTEKARRTIFFARYEASQLGSPFIETEHLLLGLLRGSPEMAERLGPPKRAADVVEEIPETPAEVAEVERRIESLVHLMEQAIANQDFAEARAHAIAEREERAKLQQLREKYHLEYAGDFHAGSVESIRRRIMERTPRREKVSTSVDLPLSHASKRVLGYAAEEAQGMKHPYIGPEHLLLGLMREEDCLAARILRERCLQLSMLREEAERAASGESGFFGDGVGFGQAGSGRHRERPFLPRPAFPPGMGGWMAAMQDAGRVLMLARHEAAQRSSGAIETMDLLLALASEKEFRDRFPGPAELLRQHPRPAPEPRRERVSAMELPFSEDSKLAFTLAGQEAARLGQRTGPGHLLLGILAVESCAAAEVLRECGLTVEGVRAQLAPPRPPSDPEQGRSYV